MRKFYLFIIIISGWLASAAQWKGFGAPISYAVAENVNLIHTKDATGDGTPDLTVLYNANDKNWGLLKGKGAGQFESLRSYIKEDNYFLSDIADLNRDGYPDMVISSYWANGFTLYFGQPGGQWKKGPYMATGVHGRAIQCIDINKDGVLDIISTTSGSGRPISLHVFIGKGDGTLKEKRSFPSVLDTCKDILITDKNNDGHLDVAVTSSFPWVLIFVQKADGSFEPTYHPTFQQAHAAFGDVNSDGKEDMILLYASFDNEPNSDSVVIKLNTGVDYFSASIKVPAFENRKLHPYQIRIADINKDGFNDLFFNHTNEEGEPTDSIFYLLGRGNAAFDSPVAIKMPDKVRYITLGDLNKDSWIDLVISCDNKTVNVFMNQFVGPEQERKEVKIYPNPAAGLFYIETSVKAPHAVSIYTSGGQLVHQQQTRVSKTAIGTKGFVAGLYYIAICGKEVNVMLPVVLQ